jgi:hypothetical protein
MIAKGELEEKDLLEPLTTEEKQEVNYYKEIIERRKELGLYDLIDAMTVECDD